MASSSSSFVVLQVLVINEQPAETMGHLPLAAFAVQADAEDWELTADAPGLVVGERMLPPYMLRFAAPDDEPGTALIMLPHSTSVVRLSAFRTTTPYNPEDGDAFDPNGATVIWTKEFAFQLPPETFPSATQVGPLNKTIKELSEEKPAIRSPLKAVCFASDDDTAMVVLHSMKVTQSDGKTPLTAAGGRQWGLIGMIVLVDAASRAMLDTPV